ncbi:MAG: alpha/beta fold hydrolase [Flavobacteriaceae bacterium]
MSDIRATIRRGFVNVPAGQMHYRMAGEGGERPFVMLHSNPGSSAMLLPLIERFGAVRRVFAPDTPGFGDSSRPTQAHPEIPDYARETAAAIDAMGIGEFDLYGTHTGANIALELALMFPERVKHLILDGIAFYTPEEKEELLERYAPHVLPDHEGHHLMWTWHFVRDQWIYWPWFKRDKDHRRDVGMPDPVFLNAVVLDVLKNLGAFNLGYEASFRYRKEDRLPLLAVPTLIVSASTDLFFDRLEEICRRVPLARKMVVGGESDGDIEKAFAAFDGFLSE